MKLVTSDQMRRLEQAAEAAGVSAAQLMENAGLAAAQEAWMLLGSLEDRRIIVLCGPGNNGGDGLVCARHLADWGVQVIVYLLAPRPNDPLVEQLEALEVPVAVADDDPDLSLLAQALNGADLVIDALLGTGRARPAEGRLAAILDAVRAAREGPHPPGLMAVDLPTGLDADSGSVDPHTVAADQTVTFGFPKLGLYTQAKEVAGRLQVVEIGIPAGLERDLPLELLETRWVRKQLPERPAGANKGTFGKVLSLTGSISYVGAAYLATAGAARAGAGLVTFACARPLLPILAAKFSEGTFLPLPDDDGYLSPAGAGALLEELTRYDVLIAGCGLSQRDSVAALLATALPKLPDTLKGVVLDADALNLLSQHDEWWATLPHGCVLTPHPGEMARLTKSSVGEVQAHRMDAAREAAQRWQHTVVLKGAGTIIAAPDGRVWLSPFSTAALATAGTGDVLAGAIAGLIAQGLPAPEAACCAVYLHGTAGELLAKELGDAGVLASDVLNALPRARQQVLGLSAQLSPPPGGMAGMSGLGALGSLGGIGAGTGAFGGLAGLGGAPGGPAAGWQS
ncbi:MAG TPA: NAD(P)H-hydrate dehydratase [Dehalococcoidia bacterium]|nr:NAD(P)H-hydrate dehydratase [Dehalococcoidia bacterium]